MQELYKVRETSEWHGIKQRYIKYPTCPLISSPSWCDDLSHAFIFNKKEGMEMIRKLKGRFYDYLATYELVLVEKNSNNTFADFDRANKVI